MELVLASTSTYRKALLDRLGLPYRAVAHACDEEPVMERGGPAAEVALTLARAKAQSLASVYPEALILGSDQVVELDGKILGKPGTEEKARVQLGVLSGRMHRLVTAVALRAPDGVVRDETIVFEMHVRDLDRQAIARYVAEELPLDCCGSYKAESRGISLFDKAVGDDFTAIMGLPLMSVCRLLRAAGVAIP